MKRYLRRFAALVLTATVTFSLAATPLYAEEFEGTSETGLELTDENPEIGLGLTDENSEVDPELPDGYSDKANEESDEPGENAETEAAGEEVEKEENEEEEASAEVSIITGFAGLGAVDKTYYISYSDKPSLEELLRCFPETLEVYLNGSSEPTDIPISWFCAGYDYEADDYYFYQFSPSWDETLYVLSDGIGLLTEAPHIFVRFTENPVSTNSVSGQSATEQLVFEYLTETMGLNVAAACGVMANIYSESSFVANNLQQTGNNALSMTDEEYTAAVDDGTYTNDTYDNTYEAFIHDGYGYGLVQWTYYTRKASLYEYAQSAGTSIGDATMQMGFFASEVSGYSTVWNTLKDIANTADGAFEAAYVFCYYYEAPSDKENASVTRGNLAKETFWEEYYDGQDDSDTDDRIYVDGSLYSGYYLNGNGLLYIVKNGVGVLQSGTIEKGSVYYDVSSASMLTLSKKTVYVNGIVYSGYYMDSDGLMYLASKGDLGVPKSGTVEKGKTYYSCGDETYMTLSKQTVYVDGKAYSGYYTCSQGVMYTVSNGTRSKKSGTIEAGKKYYSYSDGEYKTLSKQTVYVNGKAYSGYYTCSQGVMYTVSNGTRSKKSGTIEAGKKYYSYSDGEYKTLSKQTVYVNGKAYSGYYTCSQGVMYTVSNGTRSKKSGTIEAGKKYYSYSDGEYKTLSKQTVYVNGSVYTGYYMCSAGTMYKVTDGERTKFTGTLSSGTSYYSYNSGKTVTLQSTTYYSNGISAAITLKSVTSTSSRAMTVEWTTVSGASGYEVEYCTTSNFAGTIGSTLVSGSSKSSVVVSSLRNTAYYVHVRCYYTSGNTTSYSAWSDAKYVTIKQ